MNHICAKTLFGQARFTPARFAEYQIGSKQKGPAEQVAPRVSSLKICRFRVCVFPIIPWRKYDSQRPLFGGDFLGQILAADSLPGAFVHSRIWENPLQNSPLRKGPLRGSLVSPDRLPPATCDVLLRSLARETGKMVVLSIIPPLKMPFSLCRVGEVACHRG